MNTTPQLILTLSPEGGLVCELPGTQATRRQVPLRTSEAGETLLRILQAQARDQTEIGLDGAPTQKQVLHWERHSTWPSGNCRFCIAEDRARPDASKVRRAYTVSEPGAEVEVRRIRAGASGKHKVLKAKALAEDLGL